MRAVTGTPRCSGILPGLGVPLLPPGISTGLPAASSAVALGVAESHAPGRLAPDPLHTGLHIAGRVHILGSWAGAVRGLVSTLAAFRPRRTFPHRRTDRRDSAGRNAGARHLLDAGLRIFIVTRRRRRSWLRPSACWPSRLQTPGSHHADLAVNPGDNAAAGTRLSPPLKRERLCRPARAGPSACHEQIAADRVMSGAEPDPPLLSGPHQAQAYLD